MVLDVILGPPRQRPRQLDPAVAASRVRPDERGLLALRPGGPADVGPELVVPALAALLSHAPWEQRGERGPVSLAVDGDEPIF